MVSLGPRKMIPKHRILRCSPHLCDFTATHHLPGTTARALSRVNHGRRHFVQFLWRGEAVIIQHVEVNIPKKGDWCGQPNNKQSLTTPFLWVEFKTSPNGRLIIRWSTLQYILDHPEFASLFKTIQHIKHVMCSTRNGIVYTKDERNQVLDFLAMFMCCCWFRSYSWSPLMSHH